jgi:uncharacterized protein YbdZ (MbtH family)
MKNKYIILLLSLFLIYGCEEDNEIFIASPSEEGIRFTNSFADQYFLSEDTEANIAERFIWNSPDFGVETNITYELQASIDPTMATSDVIGSTTETNLAVTVKQLLGYAEDLGLDDDPTTTDLDGNPNNTGSIYLRLRAFLGAGSGNSVEVMSDVNQLNFTWVEKADLGGACDPLFIVGAAAVDAGWGWNTPVVLECASDVFMTKIKLTPEAFRFFTEEGNWGSGQNYPYFEGEGYTIDPLFENAGDGDSNFRFLGEAGVYLLVVDDNTKTITLSPTASLWMVGAATPGGWDWCCATEAKEVGVDLYQATLAFTNETFRFFTAEGDWGSGLNFPYYVDEGYTIDSNFENAGDGDSNFRFIGTPGNYTISIDAANKTISLQ